ncbi:hypothetical protein OGAPHI_004315 [Ogataea philodendri]|uniref:Uncharacterized protein n=1 Tax=Ogataea philodendri TaxID=1378263 RepID=A0A9P8T5N5_9ASCO|nr:uncharacterized protein OGAPHI_004315 [Ogataea philodendri]KAH3666126.1 hypothetical protein OGAPHI_004315 [Ogataea philodendri]
MNMASEHADKPLIVFLGGLNTNLPEFERIKQKFAVLFYTPSTRKQFESDLETTLSKVVAIYGAWNHFASIGFVDESLIERFPPSLKLITVCSAGFGGIDLKALRKRGINFCNSPTFGAAAVAETVLYHVLNGFRKFSIFESLLRQEKHTIQTRTILGDVKKFDADTGKFIKNNDTSVNYCFGHHIGPLDVHSPVGKTVSIVGFGAIGKEVGTRLSSLGMEIIYIKRNKLSDKEEAELGYKVRYAAKLEQVVAESDCIVLCLPATPESQHMINKELIDKMKKGVVLVNVGRGALINETDMIQGLQQEKIGFVGLDVYPEEPLVSHVERQDMTLTPHIGSSTRENFDQTAVFCLENIENFVESGKLQNVQN